MFDDRCFQAARLGLSEVSPPSSTVETASYVTGNDVTPYVSSEVTSLTQQIEELNQKVRDAEARCGKLAEIVRDKDLTLDLIEAEVEPIFLVYLWEHFTAVAFCPAFYAIVHGGV